MVWASDSRPRGCGLDTQPFLFHEMTLGKLHHYLKMNHLKVFKLDIGNDLGMSCKWYGFGLKGQRSRLGSGLTLKSEA